MSVHFYIGILNACAVLNRLNSVSHSEWKSPKQAGFPKPIRSWSSWMTCGQALTSIAHFLCFLDWVREGNYACGGQCNVFHRIVQRRIGARK